VCALAKDISSISDNVCVQTTIMAVEYDGGVVMGADSRTSTGSYIANRVSDKITYVADSIYVCRSGSAADTQAIADILRMYLGMHRCRPDQIQNPPSSANAFKKPAADTALSHAQTLAKSSQTLPLSF